MSERLVPLLVGVALGAAGKASHVPFWEVYVGGLLVWLVYCVGVLWRDAD